MLALASPCRHTRVILPFFILTGAKLLKIRCTVLLNMIAITGSRAEDGQIDHQLKDKQQIDKNL